MTIPAGLSKAYSTGYSQRVTHPDNSDLQVGIREELKNCEYEFSALSMLITFSKMLMVRTENLYS